MIQNLTSCRFGLHSRSDLEKDKRCWSKWSSILHRAHYLTRMVVRRKRLVHMLEMREGGRGRRETKYVVWTTGGFANIIQHLRSSVARVHAATEKGVRTERSDKERARRTQGRLVWIPRFTFTTLTTNSTELPRHKRADWVSQGWLELRVRVTQPASHSSLAILFQLLRSPSGLIWPPRPSHALSSCFFMSRFDRFNHLRAFRVI